MSERDWEEAARRRLEYTIAEVVKQIRDRADQIEREAAHNIKTSSGERTYGFQTYARVSGQVVSELVNMLPNLNLPNMIDAANDAETAWQEKQKHRTPDGCGHPCVEGSNCAGPR
jgi:hypothetical protein